MKKRLITVAAAVIVIVAAGYLGGVAWSRHVFGEQLDKTMTQLNRSPGLSADQWHFERGFFHSAATLVVTFHDVSLGGQPVEVVVPWRARHGILATDFTAQADVRGGDSGPMLLADNLSPGQHIELEAHVSHLDREGRLVATFPEQVGADEGARHVALQGARLQLRGDEQSLVIDGRFRALDVAAAEGRLSLGPTGFSSHTPGDRDDRNADAQPGDQRTDRLSIDRLRVQLDDTLPVTLKGIDWQGHTQLHDGLLRYALDAHVDGASISQQQLGSARLNASLDRLQADAAGAFVQGLNDRLSAHAGDQADDWLSLIEPIQQSFFAMLAPSPRFRLDKLELQSPMLDQPISLNGELTFDGRQVTDLSVAELRKPGGLHAFLARLDGRFTLHHAPPLLALIAGQAPRQHQLAITLGDARLSVNGRPWLSLVPALR